MAGLKPPTTRKIPEAPDRSAEGDRKDGLSRRSVIVGAGLVLLGLSRDSPASLQERASADPRYSQNSRDIVQGAQARFGTSRVSVRDFGARGDGRSVDTQAINRAIAACRAGA